MTSGSWPWNSEISVRTEFGTGTFVETLMCAGIENTCYGCQHLLIRRILDLCLFSNKIFSLCRVWKRLAGNWNCSFGSACRDPNLCLSAGSSHWTGLSDKALVRSHWLRTVTLCSAHKHQHYLPYCCLFQQVQLICFWQFLLIPRL
jgi:hypothetical protein